MTKKVHKWIPLVLLVTVMSLYVKVQFGDLLKCPSCYLFVDSADGLKNYFTAAYFVKHDEPGVWSKGMNYPYGEHIVYTDNQPIVSSIIKMVDNVIPMESHVIGTINMIMILSLILTAVILYLIMRSFGLPRWYAALLSIPITLLSPQIARFNGHYSLAYTFYLPLFILLLTKWSRTSFNFKWGSLLTGWIVFMGFTHLYFFVIAVLYLTCFGFVHLAFRRFKINRATLRSALVVLVSACIVYGSVKITDPIEDRPETVYGMYVYTAQVTGTFLPWYAPMNKVWEKMGESRPNAEGTSYLGAPAVLLFLPIVIWLIVMVRRRYLRKNIKAKGAVRLDGEPAHPVILCSAGLLIWLIATGWIHSLGGEKLVDLVPVLGQFRSLGRLAWVFYYVFGVSVAYAMYSIVHAKEAKWKSKALTLFFGVCIAFWIWEGNAYIESEVLARRISNNETFANSTPYSDLLLEKQLDNTHFQAVVQVPFCAVGSEKLTIERGGWWMRQSWQCAWETGLPIVTANLSRTSVSQTLSLVQLLSDPYIEKTRLEQMDERPLLLLVGREPKHIIDAERRIVEQAEKIGEINDVDVYSLSVSAFKKTEPEPIRPLKFQESFDEQETEVAFEGQGAFHAENSESQFFAFTDTITSRKALQFSAWTVLGPTTPVFANIRHEIYNSSGDRVHRQDYNMHNYNPHNVIGSWVETSFFIGVDGSGAEHRFILSTKDSWIDEVKIW